MNLNMLDNGFMVPIFIVSPKIQTKLSLELGFKDIQVYDLDGKPVELSLAEGDDTNYSLYYSER